MKVSAKVETITPEIAAEILLGNTHNRDYSKSLCSKYLREMCDGRWELNGEPIIIADTGRLMDGQHRLNALEQYGKPLEFLVVRGIEERTFSTIDTGAARKGKDVLSIAKVHAPQTTAAIVRMCLQHDANNNLLAKSITFSNEEILAYYRLNAEIVDKAVSLANRPSLKSRICPTASGLLVVLCRDLLDRVERFLLALDTGANLENGNPILTLRNRLERDKEAGGARVANKIALLFKAWNAYITDRTMPKIQFAPEKEGFPKLITTQRQIAREMQ